MQLTDLARECLRALETQLGAEFIVLVGKLPKKGWPQGKLIGSDSRGKFYSYPASRVLARLIQMGICTVTTIEKPPTLDVRVRGDEDTPHILTGGTVRLVYAAVIGAK